QHLPEHGLRLATGLAGRPPPLPRSVAVIDDELSGPPALLTLDDLRHQRLRRPRSPSLFFGVGRRDPDAASFPRPCARSSRIASAAVLRIPCMPASHFFTV